MNKKVLKWNFVFQYGYVLTNIFNSLLLLPLYIKNIDATTLGLWLATGNILAWITTADPGIGEVLQQRIAELRGKLLNHEISKTIGSGFIATGLVLIISILLGFGFYYFLDVIINKDLSQYPSLLIAFVISIVATGFTLVSFGLSGINQGMHNSKQVAISSLLSNLLFLIVNLLFLFWGYGVISIALANLFRAAYLNAHNMTALLRLVKRQQIPIIFELAHFKAFIRIFSFTSLSRIVSRVSENIDLIILARFIPAELITIFEINRRPINLTRSLIGRHSVALMPSLSHEKGKGNHAGIMNLINEHFKYYSYAALLVSFLFWISYSDLITAWAGNGHYAGDAMIYVLLISFFFYTIGYFMANVGYALGDIKMNSLINVIKGISIGLVSYAVAKSYGIMGVLVASLIIILVADVIIFTYRLYHIGYLQVRVLKSTITLWSVIVPSSIALGWACRYLTAASLSAEAHLLRVIMSGSLFTIFLYYYYYFLIMNCGLK